MFRYFPNNMIESILMEILILLCFAYACIYFFVWRGLKAIHHPLTEKQHSFSIIVAARNEERTIDALLASLVNQQYPQEKFEIIFANDRSTDETQSIAEKYSEKYSSVKIVSITENNTDMPNKKNALRQAIASAKNEILAFTDADCIVPPTWLAEISKHFTDDVGVVAGYSPNKFAAEKPVFNTFLRYEELKNSLWAAAGIGLNQAYMCTGRNFAYRKTVYTEVGGYEKIKHSISGDDDLFIQLVQREADWSVRYMTSLHSHVYTYPPQSFSQFVNQRIRHISASRYYPIKMKIVFSIYHLFTISTLVALFFIPLSALIFLMVKFNFDALMIAKGKEIFSEEFSVIEFYRSELLFILYSFGIGPLGIVKNFTWKGAQ